MARHYTVWVWASQLVANCTIYGFSSKDNGFTFWEVVLQFALVLGRWRNGRRSGLKIRRR